MTPTDASVPSSLVQAQQQRADRSVARLVHPVTGDDAVRRAHGLDLEHDALVWLIGDRQRLGDQAVEAGALEFGEPALRGSKIGGRGRDVDRWARVGQRVDQRGAALAERPRRVVLVAECEQVEGNKRGRGLLRQHLHARVGRVDALLQCFEIESEAGGISWVGRSRRRSRSVSAVRRGRRRRARESTGSMDVRCGCPARRRSRRGSRWTGIRPTWAHRKRRAGSSATDLASIGETGGITGSLIQAIVRDGVLRRLQVRVVKFSRHVDGTRVPPAGRGKEVGCFEC